MPRQLFHVSLIEIRWSSRPSERERERERVGKGGEGMELGEEENKAAWLLGVKTLKIQPYHLPPLGNICVFTEYLVLFFFLCFLLNLCTFATIHDSVVDRSREAFYVAWLFIRVQNGMFKRPLSCIWIKKFREGKQIKPKLLDPLTFPSTKSLIKNSKHGLREHKSCNKKVI